MNYAIDFAAALTTLPAIAPGADDRRCDPGIILGEYDHSQTFQSRRSSQGRAALKPEIRIPRVQLINAEGENLGIVPTDQALKMAEEAGLDLVEISPNNDPPVCKILDLGKLKYANQKKAAEARKKQKIVEIKEKRCVRTSTPMTMR